ncbi:MAG: ABC transporter permease [Anaerolineales bacterium]|jgi:ABC-2 type transport system permease protein
MKIKTGLVIRHELTSTLQRKSFLFMAFGVPILVILIFTVVNLIKKDTSAVEEQAAPDMSELEVEGYVDQAGLIKTLPQDLPAGVLVPFATEAAAQLALDDEEISAYYIIPHDYIESGELIYVHPDPSPSMSDSQEWTMKLTLTLNMLNGDQALAAKVWNPMNLHATNLNPEAQSRAYGEEDCSTPGGSCSNALVEMLPMIMVILFFVLINVSSGLLIGSVANEKKNRVIEILMASIPPGELLAGKIVGLGIAGILQSAAWIGTIYALLKFGGSTLGLPQELNIPTSIITWGIVYFLLGFGIYASLMAGAGALVPDQKAAASAVWLIIMPLMLGYIIVVTPIGQSDPNGLLTTAVSLFPLTAPVAMIMRLTVGGVPFWQLPLGALFMVMTVVFVVRGAARMFQAQNLLSGQPFSARRYFAALFGR